MIRAMCLVVVAILLAACGAPPEQQPAHGPNGASGEPTSGEPERLRAEVLDVLPHDPEAFTQGLELAGDTLYEATGLVGRSSLRAGPIGSEPDRTVALPPPLFGEGITVVGSRLWQLTWQDGIAIERDRHTLAELRRVGYEGEGWGLCYQAGRDRLVMSDGSSTLTLRDPDDFTEIGSLPVTDRGAEVTRLNELECVGEDVYANVWYSDEILRIDSRSGVVTARIDVSGLLDTAEAREADVLNGIAAYPGTDRFLLTGKLWPKMFTVRFTPLP